MLSNKNKINLIIVVLLLITIASIISKNNKENFTDVELIKYKSGMKGNMGEVGPIGESGAQGETGISYEINESNLKLKNAIVLGKNDLVYIGPDSKNHYSQLKLSKSIKRGGAKLKINLTDNENVNYLHCETKNQTDLYISKDKFYLNGDLELTGNINIRNNNNIKRLPLDTIPTGTIFPFYFKNASPELLIHGYYLIKNDTNTIRIDNTNNSLINSSQSTDENDQKCYIIYIKDNIFSLKFGTKYLQCHKDSDELTFTSDSTSEETHMYLIYNRISQKYKIQTIANQSGYYLNYSATQRKYIFSNESTEFSIESTIPYGWKLCNGVSFSYNKNGKPVTVNVPNLNNRYIVNYDYRNYSFGTTGGNDEVVLSTNNIPEHTHTMDNSVTHTHPATIYNGGSHNHGVKKTNMLEIQPNAILVNNGASVSNGNYDAFFGSDGIHSHEMTIQESGLHNHTIGGYGSSNPSLKITPNHMKLVYIIKT
jgi:microcystin-dependent protein